MKPILLLLLASAFGSPASATTLYGPLPYRQKSDSPFYPGIVNGLIYLEDFEDRELSPPGVTIREGRPIESRGVDEDDGHLDGFGRNYVWSAYGNPLPDYEGFWLSEISFASDPVRGYPTFVGFALLGFTTLPAPAMPYSLYRGYDGGGSDFTGDVIVPINRQPPGTPYYSTVGDQLVGMYNDKGISKVIVGALDFDHLQFGWAIPEPGAATLSGLAAALLISRRRRTAAVPCPPLQ